MPDKNLNINHHIFHEPASKFSFYILQFNDTTINLKGKKERREEKKPSFYAIRNALRKKGICFIRFV